MSLMLAAQALIMQQQFDSVGRDLIAGYRRRNDGRLPYIPIDLLARWQANPPLTGDEKKRTYALITCVSAWLRDTSGLIKVRRCPMARRS